MPPYLLTQDLKTQVTILGYPYEKSSLNCPETQHCSDISPTFIQAVFLISLGFILLFRKNITVYVTVMNLCRFTQITMDAICRKMSMLIT